MGFRCRQAHYTIDFAKRGGVLDRRLFTSNLVARRLASKQRDDSQPQADGESLDPFRADRIFALDERLTRQFGKTLAMLI